VQVGDEICLVGSERPLEAVPDFRQADHGTCSPRGQSITKYPLSTAAGQADRVGKM
jgi:hypothetical protein